MALAGVFKTTTAKASPLTGAVAEDTVDPARTTAVSDFITVQSFANFAAVTGAITAAWKALQRLDESLVGVWVPYLFAAVYGLVSIITSWDGLKGVGDKPKMGDVLLAIFIAIINALVLASAVVGTDVATGGTA